jgi:hypothetical protein
MSLANPGQERDLDWPCMHERLFELLVPTGWGGILGWLERDAGQTASIHRWQPPNVEGLVETVRLTERTDISHELPLGQLLALTGGSRRRTIPSDAVQHVAALSARTRGAPFKMASKPALILLRAFMDQLFLRKPR